MRPLGPLLIYLAFVFLGGALLAPLLHTLAEAAAARDWIAAKLAEQPFHRFVTRSLMVCAVAGLWPLAKSLGVRMWSDLGWSWNRKNGRQLVNGLVLGLACLAGVMVLAVLAGARSLRTDPSAAEWARHFLNAGLAAVLVAALEETIFRGVIFGAMRRAMDWRGALAVSSGLYALVHFFARMQHTGEVQWWTGLVVLPQMLAGFADGRALVPGFFTLAIAGTMLGLAFQRTGTLAFSIGLHAGWIFWRKSFKFVTVAKADASAWLWGTDKLLDGWMAAVVLGGALSWMVWRWKEGRDGVI